MVNNYSSDSSSLRWTCPVNEDGIMVHTLLISKGQSDFETGVKINDTTL